MMQVDRPRRGKRRLSETRNTSRDHRQASNDNTNSSVNYFFNTEISDSEDESKTEVSRHRNNGVLNIPDYNQLVKMDQ